MLRAFSRNGGRDACGFFVIDVTNVNASVNHPQSYSYVFASLGRQLSRNCTAMAPKKASASKAAELIKAVEDGVDVFVSRVEQHKSLVAGEQKVHDPLVRRAV